MSEKEPYMIFITEHQEKINLDFINDTISKLQKQYHYTDKQMRDKFPDLFKFQEELHREFTRGEARMMYYSILKEG